MNVSRLHGRSSIRTSLVLSGVFALGAVARGGTWTSLAHVAPGRVNLMLLLSDGTVMAARNGGSTIGSEWFRLTPDSHGSYVNGTWTTRATAHDTRLYYASQVLTDGRVFVAGGEYGTGGPKAEVYDPVTDTWTQTNPPASLWNQNNDDFVDCVSEILPDGRVLMMPVSPHASGVPLLYDPASNTWSNAGHLFRGSNQSEASWVKLPDDSILTIDPYGTHSERYIPASNTWVDDGIVPTSLYDPFGSELGAALLLANGNAFFLGSTGHTAIYTPTGTTSPGTWVAGPNIPGSHGTPDAPAAMMVTGRILCAVSPIPTSGSHFPSPTTFYEYDPVANSFASVGAPTGSSETGAPYAEAMLALPDGSVLFSHLSTLLHAYQPSGTPLAAGKPAIANITVNGDGSYHLVGTGLNGISEGAGYGDDLQMASNYPLVRLTDGAGVVTYARTYGWSSTSVQTGSVPVSTEFRVPGSLQPGPYSLEVVANGFASDPVPFVPSPIFTAYCFGDGTGGSCPCGNYGVSGSGCANSVATDGARLVGSGAASVFNDSVVLSASSMPDSSALFFQGTAEMSAVFGDGLRCAGGTVIRLGAEVNVGGGSVYPGAGRQPVSVQGGVSAGDVREYQVWYRNADPAFCTPSTFNLTNGVRIDWQM